MDDIKVGTKVKIKRLIFEGNNVDRLMAETPRGLVGTETTVSLIDQYGRCILEGVSAAFSFRKEELEVVKKKPFPKLMKSTKTELYVFFTQPGVGVVLEAPLVSVYHKGEHLTSWNMAVFKDSHKDIVIKKP